MQLNCIRLSGVFYFVFNRTYVYLVLYLIVYNTFMIEDVSYRIKFDTILFTVYSIAYNTFVCDYLYSYLHLIQFDFMLLYLILYYLISFVFYTMEFDNFFYPQPCFSKLYCVQFNCIWLYCILWHHAQLVVCNLIWYYSIVIIVNRIKFNLRLSYFVG